MSDTQTTQTVGTRLSVGAGIAIAGAWLAGSLVTITILIIEFVWATPRNETVHFDLLQFIFLFAVIASPMYAAYKISRLILGLRD